MGATHLPPKGFQDEYHNNTCILENNSEPYFDIEYHQEDSFNFMLADNVIYSPNGETVGNWGNSYSFEQLQTNGMDSNSKLLNGTPSADQIIIWAKDILDESNREIQH